MRRLSALGLIVLVTVIVPARAQQPNRVDAVTPLAPELAQFGRYEIGVRTIQVTDRNRADVLNTKPGGPIARYDRTLTLEVWYPARLQAAQKPGGEYRTVTRDPALTVTLHGKAVRDAAPASADGPFPLVIISHGYPGNRYLMSHAGENLASKGFIVVSIDHKESTYDDQQGFGSTLYNRPFDQLFVLNDVERLGRAGSGAFLGGLVDASRTGIIGYSMGGYGVVNVIGGGYSEAGVASAQAPPNRLLGERAAANPGFAKTIDPRIKAAVAVGPWGMQNGYWDAEGLKGIRTPLLLVAGSADDVSQYEKGTRAIYEGAVNADRFLLTFVNAGHNAGAPIPAPIETYAFSPTQKSFPFTHYADPVWDTARMNNIFNHFATAWFELHLKGDAEKRAYLDATSWKGFRSARAAVGLRLEHASPK